MWNSYGYLAQYVARCHVACDMLQLASNVAPAGSAVPAGAAGAVQCAQPQMGLRGSTGAEPHAMNRETQ